MSRAQRKNKKIIGLHFARIVGSPYHQNGDLAYKSICDDDFRDIARYVTGLTCQL
jgi:hypothetical protein